MQLTPKNFVDGIQTIQFEHRGDFWIIAYTEMVQVGNGWNYLNPKLVAGPKDKVNQPLSHVLRHYSEDQLTIIFA